jgi:hypothetical protein
VNRVEAGRSRLTVQVVAKIDAGSVDAPHFQESCGAEQGSSKGRIAVGIFLLVLSVYALTSPGRIDIVDGQARFDVAYNWVTEGRPVVTDKLIGPFMSVLGRDGLRYSYFGAPASIFSAPLVWIGIHTSAQGRLTSQFLFSLTSSIFGAGIAPILFLFYLELGVAVRKALGWTMVSSLATLLWPVSNSTFDNAQHAFFALGAVYFGYLSVRRKSQSYALAGGLMAGVLILYQEYFLLVVPALALCTVAWNASASHVEDWIPRLRRLLREAWDGPGEARSSCARYFLFAAGVSAGLVLSLAYNDLRFGSWLHDGKINAASQKNFPLFGNPLAGLLTLLVSPGKSVFLYSPPLILGILGFRELRRRAPQLVAAITLASLILISFISCISFAGGDWCWGPRYLTPLLPLWALGFPFTIDFDVYRNSARRNNVRRNLAVGLIGAGLIVQVLALSVETQRFFFERNLEDFFWARDSWFYFENSALVARVGEVASLNEGLPPTAQLFDSLPDLPTYCVLGPPPFIPRSMAAIWIRNFKIFFLPRPWPLWMAWLPPALRPVNIIAWLLGLLGLGGLGAGMIYRGCRIREWE